jgi:hypothetical protein
MRALLSAAVGLLVVGPFFACNQDSAASNAERDTHMGDVRAAAPPAAAALPPSGPDASPSEPTVEPNPVASVTATAAPPSASQAAPSATALPLEVPKKKNP